MNYDVCSVCGTVIYPDNDDIKCGDKYCPIVPFNGEDRFKELDFDVDDDQYHRTKIHIPDQEDTYIYFEDDDYVA